MFIRRKITLLLLCTFVLLSLPAFSDNVYKWIDSDGKIHYGDRPNTPKSEVLQIKKAPPPDKELEQRLRQQQELLKDYDKREAARKSDKEIRKTWEGLKDSLRGGPLR